MLAYLRDSNDSQSVIDIFEKLYLELRPDIFSSLTPILLGDNGSEFSLMMDHINSYSRPNLGNRCPYEMMEFLYGKEIVQLLGMNRISPDEVTLNKTVFSKKENDHV
jgi:hypothetical protein